MPGCAAPAGERCCWLLLLPAQYPHLHAIHSSPTCRRLQALATCGCDVTLAFTQTSAPPAPALHSLQMTGRPLKAQFFGKPNSAPYEFTERLLLRQVSPGAWVGTPLGGWVRLWAGGYPSGQVTPGQVGTLWGGWVPLWGGWVPLWGGWVALGAGG